MGPRGPIELVRVHDRDRPRDRPAYLVERLWPRGIRRAELGADDWLRDVAPSDDLRRWSGHEPAKWDEFRRRHVAELDARPEAWAPLLEAAAAGGVTLLYNSRDAEHNNAVALRDYLMARLAPADRT
jgi:uncharacterized protein YeaO (DUF488 family)